MASSLLAILALGKVGAGVAGFAAGQRQGDFQDELARTATDDRRRQAKRLLANQRVAFAKGGVDIDTGSPLDVVTDTAAEEELAALRAGLPFELQGDRFRREGRDAIFSGVSGAATTLLANPTLTRSLFHANPRPQTVKVPGGTQSRAPVISSPQILGPRPI